VKNEPHRHLHRAGGSSVSVASAMSIKASVSEIDLTGNPDVPVAVDVDVTALFRAEAWRKNMDSRDIDWLARAESLMRQAHESHSRWEAMRANPSTEVLFSGTPVAPSTRIEDWIEVAKKTQERNESSTQSTSWKFATSHVGLASVTLLRQESNLRSG
jgi:hypothetical protein